MKTTIDAAGRIVIPRDIRAAAGLEAPSEVDVEIRDGAVSITPAPSEIHVVRRGRLRVARQKRPSKKLTTADVNATTDRLRRR